MQENTGKCFIILVEIFVRKMDVIKLSQAEILQLNSTYVKLKI